MSTTVEIQTKFMQKVCENDAHEYIECVMVVHPPQKDFPAKWLQCKNCGNRMSAIQAFDNENQANAGKNKV